MIQKNLIIEGYLTQRTQNARFSELIARFPEYFSELPLSAYTAQRSPSPERLKSTSNVGSITQTISDCSTLTRVKIDKVVFDEIFEKRENHHLFIELETSNPTDKKWYIMTENSEIQGPFNTFELDQLFQNYTLTKKIKIK